MIEELKFEVKQGIQELVSGKITDRKLTLDGEIYLQWRKILEIHVRGRGRNVI